MRVVVVLKKIHGNEGLFEKLLMRVFAGKKRAQSASEMQKWANAR
jgi:hypothetical protein